MARTALALALVTLAGGCVGVLENPAAGPSGASRGPRPDDPTQPAATTAIPRLSRREIDHTLADVLGVEGAATRHLPDDPGVVVDPTSEAEVEVFDTAVTTKTPSQVFVEGLEALAYEVAREWVAESARVDAAAGCAPSGAWDRACLSELASRLGTRLWRRPLAPAELDGLLTRADEFEPNGHYVGARFVVQSLLQSPELVYRTEIGTDIGEGARRLDQHELVARLSYFLWGTTPTPELLARADAGPIDDAALAELAREMLDDPRADAQLVAFHRLWLRYDRTLVSDPELAADMRAESDALLARALVEERTPWSELFASTETFATPRLASHYGLEAELAEAGWISYGPGERAGILSHGSMLANGATRGTDTRVSARGAMIARRLLCMTIHPPADVNVDDGVEVPEGACKPEAYAAHASGSCAGCHAVIDPIGFGLERFDGLGRFREVEEQNESCVIEGTGTVAGQSFSGPAELGARLLDTGIVAQCGAEQLLRFAHRRDVLPGERALVERLAGELEGSPDDFRSLVLALVLDPSFRTRREVP